MYKLAFLKGYTEKPRISPKGVLIKYSLKHKFQQTQWQSYGIPKYRILTSCQVSLILMSNLIHCLAGGPKLKYFRIIKDILASNVFLLD